jgi:uncharacterized membrane protein
LSGGILLKMKVTLNLRLVTGLSLAAALLCWFVRWMPLDTVVGIPFLIVLPGFTWTRALFPRAGQLRPSVRACYALSMSAAIIILAGQVLSETPLGIGLGPTVATLFAAVLLGALIAHWRQRPIPSGDRYVSTLAIPFDRWRAAASAGNAVFLVLVLVMAAGMVGLSYGVARAQGMQRVHAEFSVLDAETGSLVHVVTIRLGQSLPLVFRVVNHDAAAAEYRIVGKVGDVVLTDIGPFTVQGGEAWERSVDVTPTYGSDGQRIRFALYKDGGTLPYLPELSCTVNVESGW